MFLKLGRGWLFVFAGAAVITVGVCNIRAGAAPTKAAAAPAVDGPAYAVKLTRPVKVGDRYRYVADATVVRSVTANISGRERSLRPQSFSVHLEAVEQVLAVNAKGEPSKATYAIEKCVSRNGKSEKVYLDPGRVLTVEAGKWRASIQPDEGKLTAVMEESLRFLLPIANGNGISADDCYGSSVPRRVGESWPVNADAVARLESQEGFKANPKHVSGSVKLKAFQEVDGVPHVLVQGKAVIERWVPDPRDLPPNMKFVEGSEEIKFTKLVPVGPSGHCVIDSHSERTLSKLRSDDERIGIDVLADGKSLLTRGIKRTPLPVTPVVSGAE